MAIDFEAEKRKRRKSNKAQAAKWNKANSQQVTSTGAAKAATPKPKTISGKKRAPGQSAKPRKMTAKAKAAQNKALTDYAFTRAMLGVQDGLTSATLGVKMTEGMDINQKKLKKSKAYAGGNIAGTIAGYGAGYGGVGKMTGKVAAKAVASKTGKKLVSKAAKKKLFKTAAKKSLQKAGRNATKEAVEHTSKKMAKKTVESAVKNLAADATVGTIMDSNTARAEGMKVGSKEWKDYMAKSAALNLATGGVIEAAPLVAKSVSKGGKKTVTKIVNGKPKLVKVSASEYNKMVNAAKKSAKEIDALDAAKAAKEAKEARKVKKAAPAPKNTGKARAVNNVSARRENLIKQYDELYEKEVKDAAEYIRNYEKKGVNYDFHPDRDRLELGWEPWSGFGYTTRSSNNDQWYQKFYRENGRPPRKSEAEQIAREHIDEDLWYREQNKNYSGDMELGASDELASLRKQIADLDGREEAIRNGTWQTPATFSDDVEEVLNNKDYIKYLTDKHGSIDDMVNYSNKNGITLDEFLRDEYQKFKAADMPKQPTPEIKAADVPKVVKAKKSAETVGKTAEKVGGFDTEKGGNAIVNPDVKIIGETMENASGLFDKLYKNFISGQRELEKMAKAAGSSSVMDNVQAVRNAKSASDNIITRQLVDSAGNTLDSRSFIDIVKQIPKNELKQFNEFAQHLHNVDRWKQDKPLFKDISPDESTNIVNAILAKHPEYMQISQDITEWWNKFTHAWLVDTGRVSEQAWKAMTDMYPHYVPGYRVNKGMKGAGGAKFNVASAGEAIKSAVGGSSEVIPMEDAFAAQIDKIVKGTRKNDLYLDIVDSVTNNPELKQFGIPAGTVQDSASDSLDTFLTKMEEEKIKQVNDKVYLVTGYRNGQKVSAYVNADVMRSLELLDNALGSKELRTFAEIGQKVTNPVKAGITGYNPLFAISNAARDISTYLVQSNSNIFQATSSLGKALKEMATGGEMYQQYLGQGGKNAGYYAQGKGFIDAAGLDKNIASKTWHNMQKALSTLGEGTETIPRLAEYINGVKKYGDTPAGRKHAMADAAEVTVNFSRSAPITKALDGYVLYLNAAVQGLDRFVRTVKAHPLRTAVRSAAAISAPYAALMIHNWENPNYQDLNERTKQNYFCIPNLAGEFDENGYATTFIKIPVNREYGAIFGSALDVLYGALNGEDDPLKGYGETLATNFVPPNPLTDNIAAPLVINLPNNRDFAGRAIVPSYLEDVSPINQQDASTSGVAKWIAGAANNLSENSKILGGIMPDTLKSPMKIDYLINSYGGYLGDVAQTSTSGDLKGVGKRTIIDPFKQRFTADPVYSSGVVQDFYDEMDKLNVQKNDDKQQGKENSSAKAQYKEYSRIQREMSELTKEERAVLADKSLTAEQREAKAKEIRRKRISLARGAKEAANKAAKEYKSAPTFSGLDSNVKERYNPDTGMSKEQFAKAYNASSKSKKSISKAMKMIGAGVENYEQAKSINGRISEFAYQNAQNLYNLGFKPKEINKIAKNADTNGNKHYSKEELIAYLDSTNYSTYEKAYIFQALASWNARNPYA